MNDVPEKKVKKIEVSDTPQKKVRTLESDMAEALARTRKGDKKIIDAKPQVDIAPTLPVGSRAFQTSQTGTGIDPKVKKYVEQQKVKSVPHESEMRPLFVRAESVTPPKPISAPAPIVENSIEGIDFESSLAEAQKKEQVVYTPKFEPKIAEKNEPLASTFTGNPLPTDEDHPLHILNNQVDPNKRIRTYEGDVAVNLAKKNSSVLRMAVAESERKNTQTYIDDIATHHTGRKFSFAILSVILVVGGAVGGYYLYLRSPLAVVTVVKPNTAVESVIPADSYEEISLGSLTGLRAAETLASVYPSQNIPSGKIRELRLTQMVGSTTVKTTGLLFTKTIGFNMTDTLRRSLTDRWMFGIYAAETGNAPFIIFSTDFFQNAFAGMLKWEKTMPNELAILLNYKGQAVYEVDGSFKDKIIENRDIREFIDKDGEILFLYTFIDKNTILITTSELVVPSILERIEKQTYVR